MDHWRIVFYDAQSHELGRTVIAAASPAEAIAIYSLLFGFSSEVVGMSIYDIEKFEYPVTH